MVKNFLNKSDQIKDASLLEALASLNEIGSTINRLGSGTELSLDQILTLIVSSAINVVPEAAAVIYAYDVTRESFISTAQASSGSWLPFTAKDQPRTNGLGSRAISNRRRVLSYKELDLKIHPLKVEAGAKVCACYPMLVADEPIGLLYVYLVQDREFSGYELLLLENFVNQAALAIAKNRQLRTIQQDLTRKEDELNRLRRAGMLISSRQRLDETLEAILQMALEVTGAQYGILRLVDKENKNLITSALAGEHFSRPYDEALPISDNSVMAWVARNCQAIRIDDLTAEPWATVYYPLDAELVMRSELAVPLIGASGRLEGVLNLESLKHAGFSEQDSHLLQSLATQAVIAIQEAQLLDALQEVAEILLSQPANKVLKRLVELSCDLLNVDTSAIWILDNDRLILRSANPEIKDEKSVSLYHSIIGQPVLSRSAMTYDFDPGALMDQLPMQDFMIGSKALIVPILSRGMQEPMGAFSIHDKRYTSDTISESDWDKKVVSCLAHYAALAVQNEKHQEQLRSVHEQRTVAEAFAAVGDITANLLHQLNNKVGTIPVRIQGIQDKCKNLLNSEPYLSSNLREIEHSAQEAMDAVRENLTHLSLIHIAPVNVYNCIQDAVEEAKLPANVEIQIIGLDNLPVVNAGKKGLSLVFLNLLQNAVEAMGKEGLITIHGFTRSGWVEIAVRDTGSGIEPRLHDRIFEFDFSGKENVRSGKMGFGLWWVKTWMARMGGSVRVESDGKFGTTFWLRLPYVNDVGEL